MTLVLENKVLWLQIKEGNKRAYEQMFKTYYSMLFNYAREIVKNQIQAEEIVVETFMKIWSKRQEINIETSLKPYLFRSVYNACINHIRHKAIEDKYQAYFVHHIQTNDNFRIDTSNMPLNKILYKELEVVVEKSIEKLPPQCQEMFRLSRFENLSNDEIAEKLGVTVNTVRTQIAIARTKMKDFMKDYLGILVLALLLLR
jgi:RNA polymerase sigma-70 factor, ECF subfamily